MKRKIFREDILRAGRELMFDNGYNATGIKEITDSVGIPKGSFYNHFENKEAFGLEVLQNYCDNGVRMHQKALQQKTNLSPLKSLKEMYRGIIDSYINFMNFKKGCIMGNFSAELADTNEKFREVLDIQFKEIEAIIIQTLIKAQEQGEITSTLDPSSTGSYILNSWHGALIRMKSTANAKPLEDFYTLTFNQILK